VLVDRDEDSELADLFETVDAEENERTKCGVGVTCTAVELSAPVSKFPFYSSLGFCLQAPLFCCQYCCVAVSMT